LPPRDLKARVEALSSQLSAAPSTCALEERALTAEGRAKALAASLGRKDAALREAQAAAAAARAQAAEAQAAAAAAAGGAANEAAVVRLRGELARKEAALQVCGIARLVLDIARICVSQGGLQAGTAWLALPQTV